MSKLLIALILVFTVCLTGWPNQSQAAKNIAELEGQYKSLLDKSTTLSPDYLTAKALLSQKKAENVTRLTGHLPKATLQLKKEKDFFENRNASLRALGLGIQDSSWLIGYEWSLFNFAQIQNTRKSFVEREIAEINAEIKNDEFAISFTTNFLNYLLSKYKTSAVDNSLKKAETGKKEAQLGFELGQKTKLDVLRSEANLVSLTAQKITYSDEEETAINKFVEFSGLNSSDLDFVKNLSEESILELINHLTNKEVLSEAPSFEASPLFKNLLKEEKSNHLSLAQLTSTEHPTLSIQGSYVNSGASMDQALHRPNRSHSVALVLSIPLFGSGSFVSSHFETYFAKKQLEYSYSQKKMELKNTLTNTMTKIEALEILVDSLTINVSQYEELYKLTRKSYQLGKSSLLELLEVQDNLLDSKIKLAQNKIQLYTLSQNYLWQAGLK
jgi:outer membrane protein TolC